MRLQRPLRRPALAALLVLAACRTPLIPEPEAKDDEPAQDGAAGPDAPTEDESIEADPDEGAEGADGSEPDDREPDEGEPDDREPDGGPTELDPADPADRGAWLAAALDACVVNFLWLKDSTGDLNAGPDLGAGYPTLLEIDGDRLIFATETIGMYSGGGLRGALVLQVTALDPEAETAVVEGSLSGGTLELRLDPHTLGPSPQVLEDGVAQSPSTPGTVRFADGRVDPILWGLVFSPWSSAGNPTCVRRAVRMGY